MLVVCFEVGSLMMDLELGGGVIAGTTKDRIRGENV